MSELRTQRNDASVEAFIDSVEDEQRRQDCYTVLNLMREVIGAEPKMWGESIVGFGEYHYKYASGHEGQAMADKAVTVAELRAKVDAFVVARDWRQFHNAKDLAVSICLEAAELLEEFQWLDSVKVAAASADPTMREKGAI